MPREVADSKSSEVLAKKSEQHISNLTNVREQSAQAKSSAVLFSQESGVLLSAQAH